MLALKALLTLEMAIMAYTYQYAMPTFNEILAKPGRQRL